MWIKLPNDEGLLNLAAVVRFEIVNGGTWEIQAIGANGGATTVGTAYASAADAQARLDAFLVWDLDA